MSQHILFVDDEVPIRETLKLYFKTKNLTVSTAESGAEAIRMIGETPFTLVILDLKLGEENGMDLLGRFKAMHPSLPVIMFTSMGDDPALLREAMDKGARAYMSKTESFDNLLKEVRRAMEPAAQAGAS